MNTVLSPSRRRSGFSLIEVTLAIGILGMAILSLVGILGSTFQQVDEIMQTNRALSGVTRLIGALDNPRSIVYLDASADSNPANLKYIHQGLQSKLDPFSTFTPPIHASNFEIAYRLLGPANTTTNAVWLYVYDRKMVIAVADAQAGATTTYNLYSNPSAMEVASCAGIADNFKPLAANTRNVVGTPMRVRLTLSKLLVGQRYLIDTVTGEPSVVKWAPGTALPVDPNLYALAYLPVVAEFFPHDYVDSTIFKVREETPLLVQNIIISR
jgi:type II secretory pathway pseudopilin PulG